MKVAVKAIAELITCFNMLNDSYEKQIIKRYILVGGLTTIFHVICANVALLLLLMFNVSTAVQMVLSNTFGFICCSFISYFFYAIWTFNVGVTRQSISKFKIVALFSFSAILLCTFLFESLGIPPIMLTFVATIPLAAINFFVHRYWTFKWPVIHSYDIWIYKMVKN